MIYTVNMRLTSQFAPVQQHATTFIGQAEDAAGADLPQFVKDEFDAFLECSILALGFLRLGRGDCGHDKLVAFSCELRGFCPSCGARRMAQTAAHLVDHVIPHVPVRHAADPAASAAGRAARAGHAGAAGVAARGHVAPAGPRLPRVHRRPRRRRDADPALWPGRKSNTQLCHLVLDGVYLAGLGDGDEVELPENCRPCMTGDGRVRGITNGCFVEAKQERLWIAVWLLRSNPAGGFGSKAGPGSFDCVALNRSATSVRRGTAGRQHGVAAENSRWRRDAPKWPCVWFESLAHLPPPRPNMPPERAAAASPAAKKMPESGPDSGSAVTEV